jgi:hypothetical protein
MYDTYTLQIAASTSRYSRVISLLKREENRDEVVALIIAESKLSPLIRTETL